jgi:hypothetical protein
MASTAHFPDGANERGADTSIHLSVHFVSICPKCNHEQPQGGYSRAVLGRLLNSGYPIEAYCAACDEFWLINPTERIAVAAELSSTE